MSNYNPEMGYKRCNNNGIRGFRVNIRRFSIQKLRVRFVHFFKVLFRWRRSYDRAIKSLFRKGVSFRKTSHHFASINMNNIINHSHNQSQSRLIKEERRADCRSRSLGRTNSFYSEAIADCLEFIKRNSISVNDIHEVDDEAAPISLGRRS